MTKNTYQNKAIFFQIANLTLCSKEVDDDIENHHLTLSQEKDEVTQNNKKDKPEKNLPTSEDKVMEIPDNEDSIKQPAMDAYVIKKIKERTVRNRLKQFFITWANFSESESTWEPQENMSPETVLKSYFKKSLGKGTLCYTNVCSSVQFSRQHDQCPQIFHCLEIL